MSESLPVLSIVTTLYRSATTLLEFHARITSAAASIGVPYEIIMVDDGSPDESLAVSRALIEHDACLRIVELSRNFGHHRALMSGLRFARGERVFLIDSDLEEEPELLVRFWKELEASDADVVFGVQRRRTGSLFRQLSGWLYYRLFSWLSGFKLPANAMVARLMTRQYIDALLLHRERELMIAGLWHLTGFQQLALPVDKHHTKGSTYSIRLRLALFARSMTAFSNRPLIYIAYVGVMVLVAAVAYICYLVIEYAAVGKPPAGYTSLLASVWLLGGLIIFSIGVVAVYLSVIFIETKDRPYAIVRNIYGAVMAEPEDRCYNEGHAWTSES